MCQDWFLTRYMVIVSVHLQIVLLLSVCMVGELQGIVDTNSNDINHVMLPLWVAVSPSTSQYSSVTSSTVNISQIYRTLILEILIINENYIHLRYQMLIYHVKHFTWTNWTGTGGIFHPWQFYFWIFELFRCKNRNDSIRNISIFSQKIFSYSELVEMWLDGGCCYGGWPLNRSLFYDNMQGRKDMFYLTTHSTHFIYGYMASDIWYRTIQIAR